jgi:hypothetical protein
MKELWYFTEEYKKEYTGTCADCKHRIGDSVGCKLNKVKECCGLHEVLDEELNIYLPEYDGVWRLWEQGVFIQEERSDC